MRLRCPIEERTREPFDHILICTDVVFCHTPSRYGAATQPYAFARLICCRARKTMRSPAFISADTVHRRKDTLRGSTRSADQKESSPTRCCFAWQVAHRGTA